jgi:hypothetical protein
VLFVIGRSPIAKSKSSLKGIAAALNKRRIRTARNIGRWHPTQVARLSKRLPAWRAGQAAPAH